MIKEYVNKAGYKIEASEKAYNMLYRKSGFMPVEEEAPAEVPNRAETEADLPTDQDASSTETEAEDVPADQDASNTETEAEDSPADQDASNTGKKPKKSRTRKTADSEKLPSEAETEAGDTPADPDAAELPEDK